MRVAIVGSDPQARLALVTALDAAPGSWSLSLHREPPSDADVVVCDPGAGIPGAIVFDGSDQAGLVARIATVARRHATIVVTSPSGGTGVTSVAMHLSAELVARGHDTCLVDLDPVWGVRPRLGLDSTEQATAPVPVSAGFRLLTGEGSVARAVEGFERVVIDAPPARVDELSDLGAEMLLVAAPTPEGARRARSLLDAHPSLSWRLITNRLGPGGEMTHAQFQSAVGMSAIELPVALRSAIPRTTRAC